MGGFFYYFYRMKFDWKLFFLLVIGFILSTIIGTLSHESGHYLAAKSVGIDGEIHYDYISWKESSDERWKELSRFESILPTLGGPIQTMVVGTLGLTLILFYRKSFLSSTILNWKQWILVFLTFFWSREIFNHLPILFYSVLSKKSHFVSDEVWIAAFYNLPNYSISWVLFLIALIICTLITFKFIPKNQRLTFIISGFVGGILGYLIWIEWFGKLILP